MKFLPQRSPFSLLQEDVFDNDWLVLCVAILLNCTSRKQVDKIFLWFKTNVSTPQRFLSTSEENVKDKLKCLGFVNRRYDRLKSLAKFILSNSWKDPRNLPGIGEYGARSYEIFCQNKIGNVCPNDGALAKYWKWKTSI